MNTLIYYAFNVLIFAAIVLIVGLIKPKWILLWMDQPSRLGIVAIAAAFFMGGMILFGEGNKQLQQEKAQAAAEAAAAQKPLGNDLPLTPAKPATP
jgi:hypothetical protein